MKPETLRIALAQTDIIWKDKQSNFFKIENWLYDQKEALDLMILPEMFATGFVTDAHEIAENMEGETVKWMKKMAIEHKLALMGSVVIEEAGKYYNRLVWINRLGEISYYDKRHLFTYGGEHHHFSAGNQKLVVDLYGWKICPLVCYDLRFPVWSKNTVEEGNYAYDLLIYIANWPSVRAHAFRQLLIARAIENQSFVVGVNRVGVDGKGLYYQGNSTVLDFNGNHITEIAPDLETFEIVTISNSSLQKARESFPVGNDWDRFQIM
jgi:omega-amidase